MTASAAAWPRELKRRLTTDWISKMLATTLGISVFFVVYFWVLRSSQDVAVVMPLTALDRLVPIGPWAMPFYLSLWFYVSIGPALVRDGRDLARYGFATFILSALGLTAFLLWPTSTPDFAVDWDRYPSMAFLKDVDASANACPSLHVAFAVFTGLRLDRLLRDIGLATVSRLLNLLWCVAIVYSTLAVRQHVVLDVLAGIALGGAVALWYPRLPGRLRSAAVCGPDS
jgi:membrane-associated phospholipid phosphatase